MSKFSNSQWQKIKSVEALLCSLHPKAFVPFSGNPEKVYPLKLGIHNDIKILHPEIESDVLALFMRHYVTVPRYLKLTSRAGMPRVDLEGNVTDVISEFEARNAQKFLKIVQSRRQRTGGCSPPCRDENCLMTGKTKYASAFQADQAMMRTRQRSGDDTSYKAASFKCRCGFYHWGRSPRFRRLAV